MIDTSKIKEGDEVQIANGDWYLVKRIMGSLVVCNVSLTELYEKGLITAHCLAKPVVPKGEGCVDWDKNFWHLTEDGKILPVDVNIPQAIWEWEHKIAQGNVSNNRQHLERKRKRQRIEQELLECNGAVYEPVIFTNKNGIETYVGVDRYGCIDFSFLAEVSYRNSVCNFINIETAESAIEKVGVERIRKAWGIDDAR